MKKYRSRPQGLGFLCFFFTAGASRIALSSAPAISNAFACTVPWLDRPTHFVKSVLRALWGFGFFVFSFIFAQSAYVSLSCSAFLSRLSLLLGSGLALLFVVLLWYIVLFGFHDILFPPTSVRESFLKRLRADFLPKIVQSVFSDRNWLIIFMFLPTSS